MENIRSFVKSESQMAKPNTKLFKLNVIYLPHKVSEPFYFP